MTIELTQEALVEAKKLAESDPAHHGLPLRVYIEGKGCDGFYYGVAFDPEQSGDTVFMQGDLKIVVDQDSLRFIDGSTVVWVDDERGRGFLVENPRQKKFRGKFYKKKAWMDELLKAKHGTATPPEDSTSSSQ